MIKEEEKEKNNLEEIKRKVTAQEYKNIIINLQKVRYPFPHALLHLSFATISFSLFIRLLPLSLLNRKKEDDKRERRGERELS